MHMHNNPTTVWNYNIDYTNLKQYITLTFRNCMLIIGYVYKLRLMDPHACSM